MEAWIDENAAKRVERVNRSGNQYPVTPDGRYFIVRGRLWRTTNPNLSPELRHQLTCDLMQARRNVSLAKNADDITALKAARSAVDAAKRRLGERGPAWWNDREPDYNRHLARNTPYASWYKDLAEL